MRPYGSIIAALLLMGLFSVNTLAQCCTDPADTYEYIGEESIFLDEDQIWTGSKTMNGSLVIDGELRLIECDLVITGEGIRITKNGSLRMERSSIRPFLDDLGFYIESHGSLAIDGSTISGCLDPANGYIGIYLEDGSAIITDSQIIRSGLIRSEIDHVSIENSTITGIAALGGDLAITDSMIDGVGASIIGSGSLDIRRSLFTSNLTYSNSISAISSEGGNLTVVDVMINGSYGGGIFGKDASLSVNDVEIDLINSLYGIRAIGCTHMEIISLIVNGSYGGIEIDDCMAETTIKDVNIDSSHHGIRSTSMGTVSLFNTTITNMTYGMKSTGPISMSNTVIEDVDVGLVLEDDWTIIDNGCRIIDFSLWGIEVETWEPVDLINIEMEPADSALSNYSMWGEIDIEVIDPYGGSIEADPLRLSSSIGGDAEINSGMVDLIWGYVTFSGDIIPIDYTLNGSWGNARASIDFNVIRGSSVVLELPIPDIYISSLKLENEEAIIEVGTNTSEAKGVVVTVYIDGTYRFNQKANLVPGNTTELVMPIGKIDVGDHELSCVISSDDEYFTTGSTIRDNNHMSVIVEKKADNNDRSMDFLVIMILTIAVVMIIVTLVFRRSDKF